MTPDQLDTDLDFNSVAEAGSQLGAAAVSEFTFVCPPLKIAGATGSPVRPVALVAT